MKLRALWLSFLCLSLCVLIFSSCEDTINPTLLGNVDGRVIDLVTKEPIAGATITTSPPTEVVQTGEEGYFRLTDIPAGSYAINAKATGYSNASQQATVVGDQSSSVTISLDKIDANKRAPSVPTNPIPANGAVDQPTTLTLTWTPSTDADKDTVLYDVLLYEADSLNPRRYTDISDTTLTVSNLRFGAAYYWQVTAKDKLYSTSSPVWSFRTMPFPNNRILFARNLDANFEVFSASTDGSNQLQLTNNNSRDWRPLLSPQRDLIAFTSNAEVDNYIYTMTREGRERKRISPLPVAGYHNNGLGFTWSPDGGRLLFSHYQSLYTIRRDGSDLTLIATAPADRHWRELDWTSENGGKIAAVAIGANPYQAEIYVMNEDGSNLQEIVPNLPGGLGSPMFSPDGTKLLYTRDLSGFESSIGDGRQLDSRIFLLDLVENQQRDLSGNKTAGTNDLFPRFSPDGASIIFANAANDGQTPPSVYVINVGGGNRSLLAANATTPDWK